MLQILSKVSTEDVDRKATFAAKNILSVFYDDIISALVDVIKTENTPSIIKPHHLLKALNKAGLLNSFLEQTEGSASVILSALESLYNLIDVRPSEHNGLANTTAYINHDNSGYPIACIKAADFLRDIAEANKIEDMARERHMPEKRHQEVLASLVKRNSYVQQEEPLSAEIHARLRGAADELYCQGVLQDSLQNRHNSIIEVVKAMEPDQATKYKADAKLNRGFMERIVSDKMLSVMDQSKYYRVKATRIATFIQYLTDIVDHDLKDMNPSAHNNDYINLNCARLTLNRMAGLFEESPGVRSRT